MAEIVPIKSLEDLPAVFDREADRTIPDRVLAWVGSDGIAEIRRPLTDAERSARRGNRMTAHARPSINGLPWFADDAAIGQALLGPARAGEWKQIATLLEGRGLPKIDPLMGGRYVPAVKAYFDREYRVGETSGATPDGVEDLAAWKNPGQKRRA